MLMPRLLSALVMLPLALWALWEGGVAFWLLTMVIGLVGYWEWFRLCNGGRNWSWIMLPGSASMLAMGLNFLAQSFEMAAYVYLGGLAVLAILLLALRIPHIAWHLAGLAYLGLATFSLLFLRLMPHDKEALWEQNLNHTLFLLIVVVVTDSAAYAVGRLFGGAKLAPSISPGKTWSGAIGGTLAAVMAAMGLALYHQPDKVWTYAGIAIILSIVGQAGDLGESKLKRHFKVKDSSRLIPGHGGILDRVDALSAAAIALMAILIAKPGILGS